MPANRGADHEDGGRTERAARADERSRIARELHDSTAQLLTVLQMQLHQLGQLDDPGIGSLISECQQTVRDIRAQIRALDLD